MTEAKKSGRKATEVREGGEVQTTEAPAPMKPDAALRAAADRIRNHGVPAAEETLVSADDAAGTVVEGRATASGQTGVAFPDTPHPSGAGNVPGEQPAPGTYAGGAPTK